MKKSSYTTPVTRLTYIHAATLLVGSVNTTNMLDSDASTMIIDPESAEEGDIEDAI